MIAPYWEFNGLVQSPSGYDSSRSFSSLETNDVKDMDLEFMRFKEDEEEESDGINVHGHAKLDLGLSRSDSNVCEEAGSTFKADHGFRRILMTSFMTDSDVNDDQVGETAGITEQENAPAARANKGKRTAVSSKNGTRVCANCERTTTSLWRSGPQGPKVISSATSKPTYTYPTERKASETTEPENILCSKSFEARASCLSSSLTSLCIEVQCQVEPDLPN